MFTALGPRNIGDLNASVSFTSNYTSPRVSTSDQVQVAKVEAGPVSLEAYDVSKLGINSTQSTFVVNGAGFDADNMSRNEVISMVIAGEKVRDASVDAVTRTSLTIRFTPNATAIRAGNVTLSVAVTVPKNFTHFNEVVTLTTRNVFIATFHIDDPVIFESNRTVTVGNETITVTGLGFLSGSDPYITFMGNDIVGTVIEIGQEYVVVNFTTLNCASIVNSSLALPDSESRPLEAKISLQTSGGTLESDYTQVGIFKTSDVVIATESDTDALPVVAYSDATFSLEALNFNPRGVAKNNQLLLRTQPIGASPITGRIVRSEGKFLVCEFTYINPFDGLLEAYVSNCVDTFDPVGDGDNLTFTTVAQMFGGTWNQTICDSIVPTNAASVFATGVGFPYDFKSIRVNPVSCTNESVPCLVTSDTPTTTTRATTPPSVVIASDGSAVPAIEIAAAAHFSNGSAIAIAVESLMPSHDGQTLCAELQYNTGLLPLVPLVVSLGTIAAAPPKFDELDISQGTIPYNILTNDEGVVTLKGRGFQADCSSCAVESTLELRPTSTQAITLLNDNEFNSTYSNVSFERSQQGLFSPVDQGILEARVIVKYKRAGVQQSLENITDFSPVAEIVAAPPIVKDVKDDDIYFLSTNITILGFGFNAVSKLNDVEFRVADNESLTDAEVNRTGQKILNASRSEPVVACPCQASLTEITLAWSDDGCSTVCDDPNSTLVPSGEFDNFSSTFLYARVTCATDITCPNVSSCNTTVSTPWVYVAQFSVGAAQLEESSAVVLTTAELFKIRSKTNGQAFVVGESESTAQSIILQAQNDDTNPVRGTLRVLSFTEAEVTFEEVSPTNAGPLFAQITLSPDRDPGEKVQVATLQAAPPSVTANTTVLLSNALELTIRGMGFDPSVPGNNFVNFLDGDPPVEGRVVNSTRTELTVELTAISPNNTGPLECVVSVFVSETLNVSSAPQVVATIQPTDPSLDSLNLTLTTDDILISISGRGFSVDRTQNFVSLWVENRSATADGEFSVVDATVVSASVRQLQVEVSFLRSQLGTLTANVAVSGVENDQPTQFITQDQIIGTVFLGNWCSVVDDTTPNVRPTTELSDLIPTEIDAQGLCNVTGTQSCVNTESSTGFRCICQDHYSGALCNTPLTTCEADCRDICIRSIDGGVFVCECMCCAVNGQQLIHIDCGVRVIKRD